MSTAAQALVLDVSITATWLLPDEADDASRHAYALVRSGTLEVHAPELWLWECGNIIANAVKRKRMNDEDALKCWSVLDAVRSRTELSLFEPAQVRACLALALDHGLSVYDSAYLWLAASLGLPLLTQDRGLAAAARQHNIAVLALKDLA